MAEIQPGDAVVVKDASGDLLPRRALSSPMEGQSFVIVWVSRHDEWEAAEREQREPVATPWPVEDVALSNNLASA